MFIIRFEINHIFYQLIQLIKIIPIYLSISITLSIILNY